MVMVNNNYLTYYNLSFIIIVRGDYMDKLQYSKRKFPPVLLWLSGIIFTFIIALFGFFLSIVPGFNQIGQLGCAIMIAVLYRNIFGYPETIRAGIAFSSKRLLRIAIILYGLKLNIAIILHDGIGLLFKDAIVIMGTILLMMGIAKLFKANKYISLLLGVGTGVCGAAAIAAIAPIIKAKDEDTAISVGIIALIGTVFAVVYTVIRPCLPFDAVQYGIWSGMSLHEVAHVALATNPAGEEAIAFGLLTKLGRVFLLVPLCFIFIILMKNKSAGQENESTKIEFPWFLVGFILCSIIGSYLFGHFIMVPAYVMEGISIVTTWLLTAAMVGLGLNVRFNDLRTKSIRPLLAMVITSVILSIFVYFII